MKFLHPSIIYVWSYGLWSNNIFFRKNQINVSILLVIDEMMIPHINIKNPLKSKSDYSGTKKPMKCHFSSLMLKSISFSYSENSNPENWRLTWDFFTSESFLKTEKFKFEREQLSQRH